MGTDQVAIDRSAIVAYRTEGRFEEYGWQAGQPGAIPGGCSWMSEWVAQTYGLPEDGGCYRVGDKHIAHCWNVLPDGSILDTTADQFGHPGDGIAIVVDSLAYDSLCDCGGVDG